MKTLFSLIIFSLLGTVTATTQTRLYTPKELKEDADYYFSTLFWAHPNPYYFCSAKKFNKLKKSIYRELDKKPLSKTDFILTIAQINSCLDSHSTIPVDSAIAEMLVKSRTDKMKEFTVSFLKDSIDIISFQHFTIDSLNTFLKEKKMDKDSILNSIFILPLVETKKNGLFFLGDSVHKIIAVNGILTKTMLSEANKYINKKLNPQTNLHLVNQYINAMIVGKYNINPPFRIKFDKTNREETLNGITLTSWKNEFSNVVLASIFKYFETPYTYEIYPKNSIAIFHIQTFEIKHREDFLKRLDEFKEEVNKQGIKYIFYDLSMNGGGNHFGTEAIDIVKHDTVYFKYKATIRVNNTTVNNLTINQIILHSNRDDSNIPDDRILFVLQSALTASGGDYFCRIIAENKLGILVGEPTCELTKTFSYAREFTMPHTGIKFHIASTLVDYSDYFQSLTTQPDIDWDLRTIKEFSEQELMMIINYYKDRRTERQAPSTRFDSRAERDRFLR